MTYKPFNDPQARVMGVSGIYAGMPEEGLRDRRPWNVYLLGYPHRGW
jgi:hypothetical protein